MWLLSNLGYLLLQVKKNKEFENRQYYDESVKYSFIP